MDSLAGATLVKADGSSVEADSGLEGKNLILYYFSAHWCPPCVQFTPMLKDFYDEVAEANNLEVVFVSSDRSEADMTSYMQESHGDWLAVAHNSDLAKDLRTKYGITGIPSVVVVKNDGTEVTREGRADIAKKSPADNIAAWGGGAEGGEEAAAEEGGEEAAEGGEEGGEEAPAEEGEGGGDEAPAEEAEGGDDAGEGGE